MKMSDCFKLPVYVDHWNCLADADDNEFASGYSLNEASAAAHAINCHDELVDVLERVSKGGPISMMEVENTLNRARGEA